MAAEDRVAELGALVPPKAHDAHGRSKLEGGHSLAGERHLTAYDAVLPLARHRDVEVRRDQREDVGDVGGDGRRRDAARLLRPLEHAYLGRLGLPAPKLIAPRQELKGQAPRRVVLIVSVTHLRLCLRLALGALLEALLEALQLALRLCCLSLSFARAHGRC